MVTLFSKIINSKLPYYRQFCRSQFYTSEIRILNDKLETHLKSLYSKNYPLFERNKSLIPFQALNNFSLNISLPSILRNPISPFYNTYPALCSAYRSIFHPPFTKCKSFFSSLPTNEDRDELDFDVVIVGGGIAGLSASIRLKQLALKANNDIEVCIFEKGSEIGSHIISGNIFQPTALTELFPNCFTEEFSKGDELPLTQPVKDDKFIYLTERHSLTIPHFALPEQMKNTGNFIISLAELCRWLSRRAEELGVHIFPGVSVSDVLYSEQESVIGVQTSDLGIDKYGKKKNTFQPGMRVLGKQVIFAEGCRGSLSEQILQKFNLRSNSCPQSYGIGLKEIWEVNPENFSSGLVIHTIGWPLPADVYGGGFLYHKEPNLIHLGLIVGLDYKNPSLSPYKEFQRWKTHPTIKSFLQGGNCISYGSRCVVEGGYQSIPKLTFPGGVIVGDAAGFLNVAKIKGSHTAMKSGILAAESIFKSFLENGKPNEEIIQYEFELKHSWIYSELKKSRNCRPSFKKANRVGGMVYSALSLWMGGIEPWTFRWEKEDWEETKEKHHNTVIHYPKADNILTFDILENLIRSGTNHNHDQPSHLKIKSHLKESVITVSYEKYDSPETRFCPAKVYEILPGLDGKPTLQINAQNCLHCKCCSIKTPLNYIDWTVPEGGGGPSYTNM